MSITTQSSPTSHCPPKNEDEYYKFTHHEDDLINHRLTWLLGSQSLLFAGYAVLITKDKEIGKAPIAPEQFKAAMTWIPYLGIGIAVLILIGIVGAVWASLILHRRAKTKGLVSNVGVYWLTSLCGFLPALLFPVAFMTAWWFVMP